MSIQKVAVPVLPTPSLGYSQAKVFDTNNTLRLFFNLLTKALNDTINLAESTDASMLMLQDLPTTDPANAGQVWNDSGTLKVSAG